MFPNGIQREAMKTDTVETLLKKFLLTITAAFIRLQMQ